MKEWYTILESARELKLSKNAIKYRMQKLSDEDKKQDNGVWYISAKALQEMKPSEQADEASEQPQGEQEHAPASIESKYIESLLNHIADLEKQVTSLNEQLAVKDEQIRASAEALKNQQIITGRMLPYNPAEDIKSEVVNTAEQPRKKKLFGIFG